jgi:hypothetical protein
MTHALRFTATARRVARVGWVLALVPPLLALAYALAAGGAPDWFRFFVVLAMAVPTALATLALGVLSDISLTLAERSARASRAARPAAQQPGRVADRAA